MKMVENKGIHRGDIYYVLDYPTCGCEQRAGRPAIIVSNDVCNEKSSVLEVVYLTTRKKAKLPTHVEIQSTGRKSLALCEQITSISVERLGDYKCRMDDQEMLLVNQALAVSVGILSHCEDENPPHNAVEMREEMLTRWSQKYSKHTLGAAFLRSLMHKNNTEKQMRRT